MSLKTHLTYLNINWQTNIEYRANNIVYTISFFVLPFTSLAIWLTTSAHTTLPLQQVEIIKYFLTIAFVDIITASWSAYYISQHIRDGGFSGYLIKPLTPFKHHFYNNLAQKLQRIIYVIPAILLLNYFLLPNHDWNIDLLTGLLFILSVGLAYALQMFFSFIVGLSSLWFDESDFVRMIYGTLFSLTSGLSIPIVFFPEVLQNIIYYLPFRYILSLPVEIIMKKLSTPELIVGLIIQIVWVIGTLIIYRLMYKYGMKHYQGYGA